MKVFTLKVDKASQKLIKVWKTINFNSFASESGITKKTLYDTKELKAQLKVNYADVYK